MNIKMNPSKRELWITIGFWLFLFVIHFHMGNYFQPWNYAIISATYNTFTIALMYYLTVSYLFPVYYTKGRKYFIISSIVITLLGILFTIIDIQLIPEIISIERNRPPTQFHFARYIITMAFTFFVGTSTSLIEQTNKMRETEKILTEEKLETELKLLKAQINPHFIFNALNNIYSLTYMKADNAPESVLKLSEMLRYVFYDCSKDRVPLRAEINYIQNFNAFQQMKSEIKQDINFNTNLTSGMPEIAPMLFIPFIENAFKYSRIEENENAFVNISISTNNNIIIFNSENSIPQESKSAAGSGVGINNVKHRLAIIYPKKYDLKINETNDKFIVNLTLET